MIRLSICLFAVVTLTCGGLFGQTSRGTVAGIVNDPQNALVMNARVELTRLATNVTRISETNAAGAFRFEAVDPGEYKLEIKSSGFKSHLVKQFPVEAAEAITLDVRLQIGQAVEIVEVTDQVGLLRQESPVRGATIGEDSVVSLPYQTRNPYDLALTVPGASSNKFAAPGGPGIVTYAVNGARPRSQNNMLDGADNNDISVAGQTFYLKNPDSIAEVSVQTANYDAEFGRAGGAVVNVITKSGTNDLHGTAAVILDTTWDDAISSSLSRNARVMERGHNLPGTDQLFSGTLGGPVIRNKTFFHLSYLEQRQFSTSSTQMVSPTATGRSTLLELFPRGTNPNADLLQQITAGYDGVRNTFPVALGNGRPDIEFGQVITPYSQSLRVRQYGAKIDHYIGSRDSLTGRFIIDDGVQPNGGETLSFPTFVTSSFQKTISVALYETHVFSSFVTNEFRPSFTRLDAQFPMDATNPLAATLPQIVIAGINATNNSIYGVRSTYPQGRTFNNYGLQDTLSVTHGNHTFRFGMDLMEQRARQAAPLNTRGVFTYGASSGAAAFSGLANFLDNFGGEGSAAIVYGNPTYYPSLFRQFYFAQDRWRATSNLTVSLGLRYEYYGTPMNVIYNPVFTGLFNVDPVTLDSPLLHPNRVEPDKNNWAPSIGLAYSPSNDSGLAGRLFGGRKTVFRMGYGIGYDAYFNNLTSNMVAAAPNAISTTRTSVITTANPRGVPNFSNTFPPVAPPLNASLNQTSVYRDLRNPYYQRWSAGMQSELRSGLLLDLAYVGTKGTRLYVSEDLNPIVPVTLRMPLPSNLNPSVAAPQPFLDPLQGNRTVRTNGGSSSYHAFQVEVRRRFLNGFGVSGAYTFSKAIDNSSETFNYGGTAITALTGMPSLYGGLQLDKARSAFDHPQRFVMTYSYALPFMKSQQGVLGHIAGGWNLAGITTFESGTVFSVLNGQDADGLGGGGFDRPNFNPQGAREVRARPDRTSPTGYVNPETGNAIDPKEARYIGIAANAGQNAAAPGNLGRNTERGPGLKNWDVNISKNTRLTERFSLELRGEFYNIWNTPMFGTVSVSPFAPAQSTQAISANVNNSPAGQFLNAGILDGGGRVIRYQLRLHF